MNLPFEIARRYLFAKKSQNIINIISMISSLGVMVGTAALLIVMSVFNGLNGFVGSLFGSFDPDLKIEAREGKVFVADSLFISKIQAVDGVAYISATLTDNALLRYQKRQMPAMVMGVDDNYHRVSDIDSIVVTGRYSIGIGDVQYCFLGALLAERLGVNTTSFVNQLTLYSPKRTGKINISMPDQSFIQLTSTVCGTFAVQQVDYDENYALVSLEQARQLFCYGGDEVSALCVRVAEGYDVDEVSDNLRKVVGDDIDIKDKWQQHESFFKMLEVEKLMAFIILTFIIVIAAFNIIGSLSMLIFEKKESIFILKSMGASKAMVVRVFLFEGWLVSLGGIIIGLVLGIVLVLLQQTFGLIGFGGSENYIINAYPVELQALDILMVFVVVAIVGILAAWYPVKHIVGNSYDE